MSDPDVQALAEELQEGLPERPSKPAKAKTKAAPPLHYASVPDALGGLRDRALRGDAGSMLTGWPTIDHKLEQPVLPGEIAMLAARTGVGKTWAGNTIVERALRRDPSQHALIVSLEMTDSQIAQRLAAHAVSLPPRDIWTGLQSGMVTPDDVMRLAPELDRLVIMDSALPAGRLPEAIERASDHLGAKPGLVFVDYFGLLGWDGRGQASQYERTSDSARMLKEIVKAQDVVLLLAVQLNRAGGGAGDKAPTLDSLRDSGVAEEAADRIIALWRPTPVKDADQPSGVVISTRLTGGEIEAKILKNRFGPIDGQVTLTYSQSLVLDELPQRSAYVIQEERGTGRAVSPAWWGG